MTERTHDLAALTMLVLTGVVLPMPTMSLGTFAVAVIANQLGSAVPDFDQPKCIESCLLDRSSDE